MKFRDYYYAKPMPERYAFAERLGCSKGYFDLLATGHREPGESLSIAIERETCGAVTVAELRPDFAKVLQRSGYTRSTPAQDAA